MRYALVILLVASFGCKEKTQETESKQKPNLHKVLKIVDGDTIHVEIDGKREKVRLMGVDTPETKHPSKPVECFGLAASAFTKSLLENKSVELVADPKQTREKFGRLLMYVFLEDGTHVNLELIRQGYAHENGYNRNYKYREEFREAEAQAREGKRGLWADNACISE